MYEIDSKQARQERKQRIKEGITSNKTKVPKEARLDSKMSYKRAKKDYKLAKKTISYIKAPNQRLELFSLSKKPLRQSSINKSQRPSINEPKKRMRATFPIV